jgi:hypothetical protein
MVHGSDSSGCARGVHCARLAACFAQFSGTKFLREILGNPTGLCGAKSLGDFTLGIFDHHLRSVSALRTKERAQRRCRALSPGYAALETQYPDAENCYRSNLSARSIPLPAELAR